MEHKRQILRRAARIAALVFAGAGAALAAGAVVYNRWERNETARQTRAHQDRRSQARDYLAQVAQRIVRLPVDPAVVGDVQSKYLEDYPKSPMHVWAMDVKGEFLFGVPAEDFARLNTAYDRFREEIERDAYYPDRQAFLRRLIGHEDVDFGAVEGSDDEAPRWRSYREDDRERPLFSASIKGEAGNVLGTLYMKLGPESWEGSPYNNLVEGLGGALATVMVLSGMFLWFLLPTWVYVDARERGVERAKLWFLLVLISAFLGLIVYLIARPEQAKVLRCPGCEGEVNGGAFCPHCGRDLATAFCAACRYPLKRDWVFCPSCRTEIRTPATPAQPAESAGA